MGRRRSDPRSVVKGLIGVSDTDKDKPYWVLAAWWYPYHQGCPHSIVGWPRWRRWPRRDCDLPDRPAVHHPGLSGWRTGPRCIWEPRAEPPAPHARAGQVRMVWTVVERRRVRDACWRAVAEYRAGGGVVVEPSVRQHHHQARRDWS